MGKVNGCLKCVFIFFNLLFAIIGGVLIIVTGIASIYSHQISAVGSSGLVWSWVFAIAIIGIPCLGISAACSENLCALKTFAGITGAGMIFMLICGFIVVAKGNQLKEALNMNYRKHIDSMTKDEDGRKLLKSLQQSGLMENSLQYAYMIFNIAMGIFFGFSATALLGLLISLFMIRQIKRHDSSAGEYFIAMNIVQTKPLQYYRRNQRSRPDLII